MADDKAFLREFIFVSVISADNDEFNLSEEDKQEIIRRQKLGMSWESVFEPIADEKSRKLLIEFFADKENDGSSIL